jgi:Zn-dependent protease with chaperone function
MTPKEILFVMGHEMGHYVLHHVWYFLVANTLLYFGIFFFIYRSGLWIMHRYGKLLGVSSFQHFASLPIIVILFNLANVVTAPLMNAISRHLEHQADIFGLEITQNNRAAANAFARLQCSNLANPRPGPVYMFFRATHPSLAQRIELCNSYCPWKEGKPLKYQHHFKSN